MEKRISTASLRTSPRIARARTALALLLLGSLCVIAPLSVSNAYGQTTDTTQTDQSEEDWRNSRKKSETPDIFEDIRNNRATGSGIILGPQNPIDSLPEESRRHLMKERAKLLATQTPGTPVSAPYTPSEAAKQDTALQSDESAAWADIIKDIETDSATGSSGTDSASDSSNPPSNMTADSGAAQDPATSSDSASVASPVQNGSNYSAAQILAQIKGTSGQSDSSNDTANDTSSESTQADSGTQASSNQSATQNATQDLPISPLDYIKSEQSNNSGGSHSSASDYMRGH